MAVVVRPWPLRQLNTKPVPASLVRAARRTSSSRSKSCAESLSQWVLPVAQTPEVAYPAKGSACPGPGCVRLTTCVHTLDSLQYIQVWVNSPTPVCSIEQTHTHLRLLLPPSHQAEHAHVYALPRAVPPGPSLRAEWRPQRISAGCGHHGATYYGQPDPESTVRQEIQAGPLPITGRTLQALHAPCTHLHRHITQVHSNPHTVHARQTHLTDTYLKDIRTHTTNPQISHTHKHLQPHTASHNTLLQHAIHIPHHTTLRAIKIYMPHTYTHSTMAPTPTLNSPATGAHTPHTTDMLAPSIHAYSLQQTHIRARHRAWKGWK